MESEDQHPNERRNQQVDVWKNDSRPQQGKQASQERQAFEPDLFLGWSNHMINVIVFAKIERGIILISCLDDMMVTADLNKFLPD